MTLKEMFKKWLAGKIQINITFVTDGVTSTVVPYCKSEEIVHKSNKSNYRFCMYEMKDPGSELKTYYYTEVFVDGKWGRVDGTWFADKDKAMQAHAEAIGGKVFESVKRDTVLWEGLSKEEAETWIGLQKSHAP